MNWQPFIVVGAPLVRATAGWLENSLRDGHIDFPEWRKLAETLVKLGVPAAALYWGLNLDATVAAAIPVLVDYALSWFGKRLNPATNAAAKKKKK